MHKRLLILTLIAALLLTTACTPEDMFYIMDAIMYAGEPYDVLEEIVGAPMASLLTPMLEMIRDFLTYTRIGWPNADEH